MQEITGDLFASERADAICITTNGFVNSQGACTMGRGCAAEAKRRWPGIQMNLGAAIQKNGNNVNRLTVDGKEEWPGEQCLPPVMGWPVQMLPYYLFSFPVKPAVGHANADCSNVVGHKRNSISAGESFPGWAAVADLGIIEQSCIQLVDWANQLNLNSIVLPRPGCGAGELSWEDEVRPLCMNYLDDRFYAITFPPR